MHANVNGLAFIIMVLASATGCTIAYWAGRMAR